MCFVFERIRPERKDSTGSKKIYIILKGEKRLLHLFPGIRKSIGHDPGYRVIVYMICFRHIASITPYDIYRNRRRQKKKVTVKEGSGEGMSEKKRDVK